MTTSPSPLLLALDFGGSQLSAALAHLDRHEWLAHRRHFSPADADRHYQYQAMLDLIRALMEDVQRQPAACGVSFGGPVDAPHGLVRLSPHVPGWENVPLADWLRSDLDIPVVVDNDANVAALGEFRFGAGQGFENLLYVTVSTGIGGGWVLAGRLYGGADGLAGEIGHTTVQPDGLPCPCGRRGCLEAEASGLAIARRARLYLAENDAGGKGLLALVGNDPAQITAQQVSQAAAEGDPLSRRVLADSARQLGRGLRNAILLMNPQRVILGGGVTKAGDHWWQTVRETASHSPFSALSVDIVPAELGDDAPLWGAVALAETVFARQPGQR